MEKTYTFIAKNANLFFGSSANFSIFVTDPWDYSGGTELISSTKPYIGRTTKSSSGYNYWRCKAYFGDYAKQLDDLKTQNIINIKLRFSECNRGHYKNEYYWDTAVNAPSVQGNIVTCDFKGTHPCNGNIKEVAFDDARIGTAGISNIIELDVTEYGIPASYSWLFKTSTAAAVRLCNDGADNIDEYDNIQVKLIITVQEPDKYQITYNPGSYGKEEGWSDLHVADTEFPLPGAIFTRESYIQDGWVTEENSDDPLRLGSSYRLSANTVLYPHWDKPEPPNKTDLSSKGLYLQSIFLAP